MQNAHGLSEAITIVNGTECDWCDSCHILMASGHWLTTLFKSKWIYRCCVSDLPTFSILTGETFVLTWKWWSVLHIAAFADKVLTTSSISFWFGHWHFLSGEFMWKISFFLCPCCLSYWYHLAISLVCYQGMHQFQVKIIQIFINVGKLISSKCSLRPSLP